jgi:hypothetical protein
MELVALLGRHAPLRRFGAGLAVIRGAPIPHWERYDLAGMPVRAVVDGATDGAAVGSFLVIP